MTARLTPDETVRNKQPYPRLVSYAAVARVIGRSASAVARYVKLAGTPRVVRTAFRETVRKRIERVYNSA